MSNEVFRSRRCLLGAMQGLRSRLGGDGGVSAPLQRLGGSRETDCNSLDGFFWLEYCC